MKYVSKCSQVAGSCQIEARLKGHLSAKAHRQFWNMRLGRETEGINVTKKMAKISVRLGATWLMGRCVLCDNKLYAKICCEQTALFTRIWFWELNISLNFAFPHSPHMRSTCISA
eukprot:7496214-Pyramimonas_sp.AAC.1